MGEEVPMKGERHAAVSPTNDLYENTEIEGYGLISRDMVNPHKLNHQEPPMLINGQLPSRNRYVNNSSAFDCRTKMALYRNVSGVLGEVDFDSNCNELYNAATNAQLLPPISHLKSEPPQQKVSTRLLERPKLLPPISHSKSEPPQHKVATRSSRKPKLLPPSTHLKSEPPQENASNEMSTHSYMSMCLYLKVIFIVATLVIQCFLLVLGCYTFLRTERIMFSSSLTTASSLPPKTIQELSDDFNRLKLQLEALQNISNAHASGHNATLDIISVQLDILSETVDNLNDSLTPSTDPVEISSVCTTVERKCQTNETVSPSLNFSSCITPRFLQSEVDSSNYITNLQCSVDVDYVIIAPVGSTLVVEDEASDDAWLCRCMGIKVVHPHLDPVGSFNCILQITMCPKTIPFPLL